jgi:prepilin-type N-terminal cleavage/methylation domain-containing protein
VAESPGEIITNRTTSLEAVRAIVPSNRKFFVQGTEENQMRKQKGFSLIELLIVVAIILIIAAIAIPNLVRSKVAANQASAVASTRTLVTAQATYSANYQTYADKLDEMAQPAPGTSPSQAKAGLIDNELAKAVDNTAPKSGYYFVLTAGADLAGNTDASGATSFTTYNIQTVPVGDNGGIQNYCTDQSGVVRWEPTSKGAVTCKGTSKAIGNS